MFTTLHLATLRSLDSRPPAHSSTHALITIHLKPNEFLLLLLPLPSHQRNQIFMSEGKVFCALLLSGKSAMRLIVVLKRKIQQDYEANWLCAFVLFLLWHQCDNVMSVMGEKKKKIIKSTYFWSSFILSGDDLNMKCCCLPAGLCFLHLPGCTCPAEAGEHLEYHKDDSR